MTAHGATTYPRDLCAEVARVVRYLDAVAAWPNALERHAALEDIGVVFGVHLERAMAEADIARAALGR